MFTPPKDSQVNSVTQFERPGAAIPQRGRSGARPLCAVHVASPGSCLQHRTCSSLDVSPRAHPSSDPCPTASPPGYTFPFPPPYRRTTMIPRVTAAASIASTQHHHKSPLRQHPSKMSNFAPFQDDPETQRALSPPPLQSPRITSPRMSSERTRAIISPPTRSYEQHDYFGAGDDDAPYTDEPTTRPTTPPQASTYGFGRSRQDVDMFTTSLGWRLDYEAVFAYLALPPAGGVFLLVMEHQSDYVRFHAWQSALLFSFVFVIHVIFSWSSWISWILFMGDVCGVGWLGWRAYVDAETLDRYEVPFFGPLASSILDDE